MNRPKAFIASLLLVAAFISCTEKRKPMKNTDQPTEVKQTTGSYNPGSNWQLIWSDEFDGDSIDLKNWSYQVEPAGRFNEEWQRYTNSPENAYVENSCLVIKAIHESETHGLNQYTSARINSANKQSFRYGKIAARMKLPFSEGIWPAFWMLGANIDENGGDTPWPQCGEIDILELYGSKDDGAIESNIHFANEDDQHESMGAVSYELESGKFADDFHVFELEWNENQFVWSVNGEQFATADISGDKYAEFHEEFFFLFNIAVGGTWAGRPDETSVFPQYMYIDWVRVYNYQGS